MQDAKSKHGLIRNSGVKDAMTIAPFLQTM
jgi:hypothetical protein